MEKSQSEIVVGGKTRPYGINHAVSRGETEQAQARGTRAGDKLPRYE